MKISLDSCPVSSFQFFSVNLLYLKFIFMLAVWKYDYCNNKKPGSDVRVRDEHYEDMSNCKVRSAGTV